MSSSSPSSPSPSSAAYPRIQFANLPISLLIFFGMWVCYEAGHSTSMPHPFLEHFKSAGLFLFRTESVLRGVFWAAVVAHIYEALLALNFARKVLAGRKMDVGFMAFWTIQTALVGFPSLKLLKEQRRLQIVDQKRSGNKRSLGQMQQQQANSKKE